MDGVIEQDFHAPSVDGAIDHLIAEREARMECLRSIADLFHREETREAVRHFHRAAMSECRVYIPEPERVYRLDPAVAAMDAEFWSRALNLTDLLDYMPEDRRREWRQVIDEHKTPEFTAESVYPTMRDLLASRMTYLAEMVDGIFRGLSGEHVTNRPEGFAKRMIVRWAVTEDAITGRSGGHVHDLRCVIAKLQGRQPVSEYATRKMIGQCRSEPGEWFPVDGGAFRLKVHKKGTGHMEVHPDLAWQLNQILAHLHPQAIPAPHRTAPSKQKRKTWTLMDKPLPAEVLNILSGATPSRDGKNIRLSGTSHDKHAAKQANDVLRALGAYSAGHGQWACEHDIRPALRRVLTTGTIPDEQSHQFYPTPPAIVDRMMEELCPGKGHRCLEPSAGQGAIADWLPDPDCVEISSVYCDVLRAKGYSVTEGDFLALAHELDSYDRIAMNPPFSQGRAEAHLEAAAGLLSEGGKLVAVVPASTPEPEVAGVTWHDLGGVEFPGVSIKIKMVKGERT